MPGHKIVINGRQNMAQRGYMLSDQEMRGIQVPMEVACEYREWTYESDGYYRELQSGL